MLNPLQEKLLEMITWLSAFIDEHNLRYYAIGGTFLGAVRHNGFIPWDDDLDIAMPRPDYEILINLLSKQTNHYIIEYPQNKSKDFLYNFAKFYDTKTTMVEKLRINVKRGVYIDIFPLDGLGNTYEVSLENYKEIDRCNMLLAIRSCAFRKDRKWWKNLMILCGRLFPIKASFLAFKVNELCKKRNYDECLYVASCMSPYRQREIMKKEYFGTPKEYSFENIKIKGPELSDEYLTHLFGNWQELPPEDKRHSAHDFIYLDLEKPYMT